MTGEEGGGGERSRDPVGGLEDPTGGRETSDRLTGEARELNHSALHVLQRLVEDLQWTRSDEKDPR